MRFLDQKRETVSGTELRAQFVDVAIEFRATGVFPAIRKPARTRGIVKIQDRSLDISVAAATGGGMKRIAFKLHRSAVNRRSDERDRAGATRHCRCVIKKFSGNRPFRALGERHEMHFGATTAR